MGLVECSCSKDICNVYIIFENKVSQVKNINSTNLSVFSGNLMGDLGARMLSKALQINNKLKTIFWDKNNTTCQGFEDVAEALQK